MAFRNSLEGICREGDAEEAVKRAGRGLSKALGRKRPQGLLKKRRRGVASDGSGLGRLLRLRSVLPDCGALDLLGVQRTLKHISCQAN
jgi:hypothetical protein